jgi:hypothetical protein
MAWLRGLDLNQRPPGYEPDELPGCSTPRKHNSGCAQCRQTLPSVATIKPKLIAAEKNTKENKPRAAYQELYGVLSNGDSLSEEEFTSLMP